MSISSFLLNSFFDYGLTYMCCEKVIRRNLTFQQAPQRLRANWLRKPPLIWPWHQRYRPGYKGSPFDNMSTSTSLCQVSKALQKWVDLNIFLLWNIEGINIIIRTVFKLQCGISYEAILDTDKLLFTCIHIIHAFHLFWIRFFPNVYDNGNLSSIFKHKWYLETIQIKLSNNAKQTTI